MQTENAEDLLGMPAKGFMAAKSVIKIRLV